jgi:N-acetylglucosamine-6-phosphate deacetylase
MTGFTHRAPGVVGAAFDTEANCEIIADNVHSHPAAQRLLYHAKGGKNIVLITDSLRACGLGDGPSELGGQEVFVKGELATLKDGTIAGSVATMNRCVKIFWENTGAELPQIIEMVTKTPAQELALYEEIGSLESGKRADIVIFDEEVRIHKTVIGGKVYYHD